MEDFFIVYIHNTDTFKELLINISTLFFHSSYQLILTFLKVTMKQYYTYLSKFISTNTDSFRELLWQNITHIFWSLYQPILTVSESYYYTTSHIFQNSNRPTPTFHSVITKLILSENYCRIILNIFLEFTSINTKVFRELLPTLLTHFMPLISFDTLWKHQKTRGFLMFSEGIKRDQWHEMG